MAIHGIGVIPLINMLSDILSNEYCVNVNVIAYVDDFSAAGNLQDLRGWWSFLTETGPKFGYYSEPTKTWLVVNPCASEKVESVFFGTKIKITTRVQIYLGESVGTRKFKDLYITTKDNEWITLLELLSKIAAAELQSAYYAFTVGFKHKVTYTMRTIPDICQNLQKLDQYFERVFIPALIDGHIPNNVERKLLSLPGKLGSMGIVIFADIAKT